jgi:hypothetical protein
MFNKPFEDAEDRESSPPAAGHPGLFSSGKERMRWKNEKPRIRYRSI